MSLQYIKKEVRKGVHFQLADKHQSFLQVDFNILGIKDAYKVILSILLGMIKHSQITRSNISKKEVRKGDHFLYADEHQSFYKLGLFFDESGQIYPKYPKQEVGNIFAKSVAAILCSIVMQNIRIFYGGPAMFIITCFLAQPDQKFSA